MSDVKLHDLGSSFKVIELHPSADPIKNDAWMERESKKYPSEDFDREFRLLPVGRTDAYPVFPDYQRQNHEDPLLGYKRHLRYIYRGWDFGKVHPCVEFIQPEGEKLNCIYEVFGTNIELAVFASRVLADSGLYFPNAVFVDWGDASGVNQRDDGRSSVKVLRDLGIAMKYRKQEVEEGIQSIAKNLVAWSEGRPKLQVNPTKCPHLIAAMRGGYRRDPKGKIMKDGKNDHPVDAMRYAHQGIMHNIRAQFYRTSQKKKPQTRPLTDCELFTKRGRI